MYWLKPWCEVSWNIILDLPHLWPATSNQLLRTPCRISFLDIWAQRWISTPISANARVWIGLSLWFFQRYEMERVQHRRLQDCNVFYQWQQEDGLRHSSEPWSNGLELGHNPLPAKWFRVASWKFFFRWIRFRQGGTKDVKRWYTELRLIRLCFLLPANNWDIPVRVGATIDMRQIQSHNLTSLTPHIFLDKPWQ